MQTNLKDCDGGRNKLMWWVGNDHCSTWHVVSAGTMHYNLSLNMLCCVSLSYPDVAFKLRDGVQFLCCEERSSVER
jgi:hypothetical protein